MKIEVSYRNYLGRPMFYPLSDDAKAFCAIIKRKSFTIEQLRACKKYGWEVNIKADVPSLEDFDENTDTTQG